jgi:hypothetical protein
MVRRREPLAASARVAALHPNSLEVALLVRSGARDNPVTAKFPEVVLLVQWDARDSQGMARCQVVDRQSDASVHLETARSVEEARRAQLDVMDTLRPTQE